MCRVRLLKSAYPEEICVRMFVTERDRLVKKQKQCKAKITIVCFHSVGFL